MLDPRRLRVLREVAARGSFSAAAEALAFTQSAVSQQVAALERETATRLVERGVRPVRLTDAGRALLAHAEAVLARLDQAEQELGELAGLRRGRLRIASFPTAIATLVPRAVAHFNQLHPNVELTVVDDHLQGLLPRLARWELDLALIYDHRALADTAVPLERTHLLDDPFDLVVPEPDRLTAEHRCLFDRTVLPDHGRDDVDELLPDADVGRPASSHAWSSAATTTTRCRRSSPSGWASRSSPAWHSPTCAQAWNASP